jgi:uncharacterized protein YegP (UPF0339 family)
MRAAVEFQVYRERSANGMYGDWRWRARARNGRIVADSGEAYSSRAAASTAVERLVRHIGAGEVRVLEPDD